MLSDAQRTTLGNDIAVNTATIGGVAIKDLTRTADNAFAVANWYNGSPVTDFWGNYKNVPLADVKNAITFKNYTPTDAVPTPAVPATTEDLAKLAVHQARTLVCQTFQFSINNILLAGDFIDATKASIVSGLKDATNSDMPSGVNGASRKGGWVTVQTILCRKGTNAEKLFANITGGTGASTTTAATFTFEGQITDEDIRAIWGI